MLAALRGGAGLVNLTFRDARDGSIGDPARVYNRVRRDLLAAHRLRVAMTRSGDTFLPPDERVAFAEDHVALFVSLHANESSSAAMFGLSMYRFA